MCRSKRRFLGAALSAMVVGVWLTSPFLNAQNEAGLRLVVLPESIGLSYNAPTTNYVFFTGEPVGIAIRLLNHTRNELTRTGEKSLEQQSTKVVRIRRESTPAPVLWSRAQPQHRLDGSSPIPPNNYAEIRWSLSAVGSQALAPGVYDIIARLSIAGSHELADEKTIEVRAPRSRLDRLDALMHTAIRARWDNDLTEARKALQALLALNPNSASAYAELGAVLIAARDCRGAVQALDRAISIIQARSDQESPRFRNPQTLNDWESGLRSAQRLC